MVYITYVDSPIDGSLIVKNVWSVGYNNVEEQYIEFMLKKANEINIVISPYWLSIMNWKDHNNHLSIGEYGNKKQQWTKIKRQWNIDKFISENLKGYKLSYREVIRL